MTRTTQQKYASARERVDLLEATLHQVWLWLSTDADNPEALRLILLGADKDAQLRAALDKLVKSK